MSDISTLLPCPQPVRFLEPDGSRAAPTPEMTERGYELPGTDDLLAVWRGMVLGRRFDAQATALTKQGRLAVYPSSRGQDACQVAPVLALEEQDWLFPTYRDSMALVTRGIDPVQVLTLLRGDWHCGYDPVATRTAAQCTPLATQAVHAAGAADGMRRRKTGGIALCLVGDGATSEGDFHEGLNFAGVYTAPVVYLVQNNKYAISVPLAKQTKAPALAYKGIGYGVRSEQVDGNDPAAVLAVTRAAYRHAREGHGPVLVEAHTYRMEAHTNADDATRYRTPEEVDGWTGQDPVVRLQAYLVGQGVLDDTRVEEVRVEAEDLAADLRTRMNAEPVVDPMELFEHVYAEPTPQLREQAEMVRQEIAATASTAGASGTATPTPTKETAR
ncbi:thiamine pyrophosphate-dependent dehydrogenase E1 component subunit alpha [Ornithinimicrobium cerasi]|uniref:2-oxoisovalerate dehydrogenase subunit alpha n=1 Tax=Ornithinimicrobium cerasi TaxID=2248773 RepID=A0A285VRQ8_9MICO|nr:thiamine pyrophosphate-dependent dehydrogenase E1 component subunit alpha [Ornithinimicrobium cerasi]SOC56735.1 pyruvate dehydrogenase E1 component alpha subunit [Ornithinimicrobium cerasi]